jgi:hypothetical protein
MSKSDIVRLYVIYIFVFLRTSGNEQRLTNGIASNYKASTHQQKKLPE